jgi:flagellar motility protein MotE (MotC chaperone)
MDMHRPFRLIAALAAVCLFPLTSAAQAAETGAHAGREKAKPAPRNRLVQKLPPDIREDYQKYCFNIADDARDARYARQKKTLEQMEGRLRKLLKKLEKKRAEYEAWVLRRQQITERITNSMLKVYAKMEPEAAAAQIAQMEYAVAVAILTGLGPQKASAILNEMDPRKAGRLVNVIVGAMAETTKAGETN